jgi:hypothetical protein
MFITKIYKIIYTMFGYSASPRETITQRRLLDGHFFVDRLIVAFLRNTQRLMESNKWEAAVWR